MNTISPPSTAQGPQPLGGSNFPHGEQKASSTSTTFFGKKITFEDTKTSWTLRQAYHSFAKIAHIPGAAYAATSSFVGGGYRGALVGSLAAGVTAAGATIAGTTVAIATIASLAFAGVADLIFTIPFLLFNYNNPVVPARSLEERQVLATNYFQERETERALTLQLLKEKQTHYGTLLKQLAESKKNFIDELSKVVDPFKNLPSSSSDQKLLEKLNNQPLQQEIKDLLKCIEVLQWAHQKDSELATETIISKKTKAFTTDAASDRANAILLSAPNLVTAKMRLLEEQQNHLEPSHNLTEEERLSRQKITHFLLTAAEKWDQLSFSHLQEQEAQRMYDHLLTPASLDIEKERALFQEKSSRDIQEQDFLALRVKEIYEKFPPIEKAQEKQQDAQTIQLMREKRRIGI